MCRVTLVLFLCLTAIPPSASAQNRRYTLEVGGMQRSYRLHVPPGLGGDRPALVVALHGRLGTGAEMARLSRFDALADREHFLVAYPDGWQRSWADGRSGTPADKKDLDDVGFISAMLDDIARRQPYDPSRVYAAGISNGGFMSERLACDLGDRFAAIGVVAATLADYLASRCRLSHPMSVMLMNGTLDPLVPFGGGDLSGGRGHVLSVDETVATWAGWDRCSPTPATRTLPNTANDGTRVSEATFGHCAGGAEVVAYRIDGGGHTWPGGSQYLPVRFVGKASRNLAGSEALWGFFSRHHR